jgi:hypothetical protein
VIRPPRRRPASPVSPPFSCACSLPAVLSDRVRHCRNSRRVAPLFHAFPSLRKHALSSASALSTSPTKESSRRSPNHRRPVQVRPSAGGCRSHAPLCPGLPRRFQKTLCSCLSPRRKSRPSLSSLPTRTCSDRRCRRSWSRHRAFPGRPDLTYVLLVSTVHGPHDLPAPRSSLIYLSSPGESGGIEREQSECYADLALCAMQDGRRGIFLTYRTVCFYLAVAG